MAGREPSERELLVALWDASTAKPASKRGLYGTGAAAGNLVLHAVWATEQFGKAEVLRIWGWSTADHDVLTSSSLPKSRSSRRRGKGSASEAQRRWNEGPV